VIQLRYATLHYVIILNVGEEKFMEILKKLFASEPISRASEELEQKEKEAIIDLLLIATYADNHLSLAENEMFKEEVDKFSWEANTPLDTYLNDATNRARSALDSDETVEAYLETTPESLSSISSSSRTHAFTFR